MPKCNLPGAGGPWPHAWPRHSVILVHGEPFTPPLWQANLSYIIIGETISAATTSLSPKPSYIYPFLPLQKTPHKEHSTELLERPRSPHLVHYQTPPGKVLTLYTSPYPSDSQGSFLETQTWKPHSPRFFFDWAEMGPRNPPDPQQFGWCWGWHFWPTGQHGRAGDLLLPLAFSLAGFRRLHLSAISTFLVQICSVSLGGSFFFCLSPLRCWLPLRHHISWPSLLLIQDATQLDHHWARLNHQLRMLSLLIFPFPDYFFLITFFLYHMSSSFHCI